MKQWRLWRPALSLGIAGVLTAAAPAAAYAASPEFARSPEEWAQLRDNVLEYEEIAGLVHEYNATVQQNAIDYNEFRKEYGDTNDDVAERYRELASDMRDAISYPDVDDSNYGSVMAQVITNEQSAQSYEKLADNALEDSYVKYMTNCQTEANLVKSAQTAMITYYVNQLQLQIDQKARELQQDTYQYTVNQKNVGMATDIQVLSAQEAVRNTEQAIINDQSSIDTGKKSLLVMLGWAADANPEIREIPDVDESKLEQMNPETDKEAALANNYTLLINQRQLQNSRSTDKREELQTAVASNQQNISASLSSSYQAVLSAKTAWDLAQTQAALDQQNLQMAQKQAQVGQLDSLSLKTKENTAETAQLNAQIAKLKLFLAMQDYQWAVNGLADA